MKCIKFPTLSAIDFVMCDIETSNSKNLIEFKDRNVDKNKYSTFFISENKLKNGLELSNLLQLPLVLVVQWKDQLGWIKIKSLEGYDIKQGGRKDRGVANDQEAMVHIPTELFKVI